MHVEGDLLVVVVADGAGSATHSQEGSQLACHTLATLLVDVGVSRDADSLLVENRVRSAVLQTRDRLLQNAEEAGLAAREFACTLLCAVLGPHRSAFAQIGDGAIVTPEPGTSEWNWLFWPERGEYANTTYFLTDATAEDHVQVDVVEAPIDEVALFTDGIQNLVLHNESQSVHSPFFEKMISVLRDANGESGDPGLNTSLERYLTSPPLTERADDDLTLVLASRREV